MKKRFPKRRRTDQYCLTPLFSYFLLQTREYFTKKLEYSFKHICVLKVTCKQRIYTTVLLPLPYLNKTAETIVHCFCVCGRGGKLVLKSITLTLCKGLDSDKQPAEIPEMVCFVIFG
jgi:hypothetical protein